MVAKDSHETLETIPEIARRTDTPVTTVRNTWRGAPDWPAAAGRRGRYNEYRKDEIDAWLKAHGKLGREPVGLSPRRLYTMRELGDALVKPGYDTIRGYRSRGQWPAPDDETDGTPRWYGRTIEKYLAERPGRGRRPGTRSAKDAAASSG